MKRPREQWIHWLAVTACSLGILIVAAETAYLWIDRVYTKTFMPGVRIGSVGVGGDRYLETLEQFDAFADRVSEAGLTFAAGEKELVVTPAALATDDPDLAVSLVSFDVESSVDAAYAVGRSGAFWRDVRERVRALFGRVVVPLNYELNAPRLTAMLEETFGPLERPATEAAIVLTDGELSISPEAVGERFDIAGGLAEARRTIEALRGPIRVELAKVPDEPTVTEAELRPRLAEAEAIIDRGPVKLETPAGTETIEPEELAAWFIGRRVNGTTALGFGLAGAEEFLAGVADRVNIKPEEGRFELKDGQLTELKPGQAGRSLDPETTLAAMETAYVRNGKTVAVAVVRDEAPRFSGSSADRLGSLELLGTGHSNFRGSPRNRQHNIATGAAALHGLVIDTDKEFSLAEALGAIEKETGYLPELVIKGDKTIPEYGGGLCQIGTTTFRAAMAAALPITERRNHSYSVSYYLENGLPGTDATIYPPHPDLRFLNDTGHPILIQVRTEGNDLYFDFYGTKDGRTAERTTPRVWDRVNPPPTKEIESPDLSPGERKCTERAHQGIKAEFTYTIRYPNGETNEQVFRSTYKPWQEVCLVGASG